VLFAPNALCVKTSVAGSSDNGEPNKTTNVAPGLLGQGYIIVRSRLRVTLDGGHSLLAVQDPNHSTRLSRISGVAQVSTNLVGQGDSVFTPRSSIPVTRTALPAGNPASSATITPTLPNRGATVSTSVSSQPQVLQFVNQATSGSIMLSHCLNKAPAGTTVTSSCAPLLSNQPPLELSKGKHPALDDHPDANSNSPAPSSPSFPTGIVHGGTNPSRRMTSSTGAGSAQDHTSDEKRLAATRRFLSQLLLEGHQVVTYDDAVRHLVGPDRPPPYQTTDEFLALLHAASLDGQLQLIEEKGGRWLALPNIFWSPFDLQSAHISSTDSATIGNPPADSVVSTSQAVPKIYQSILQVLADAHASGFPLVGQSFISDKANYTTKTFRKAFNEAIRDGQVLIASVNVAGGGRWARLPDDSEYRRPCRAITREIPTQGDPHEFDRLLAYLPPNSRVLRKKVRKHFIKKVPDTPYGQDGGVLNIVLDRAQATGLIRSGGTEKKEMWVQRA
jgi:hypothetical protein